MLIMDGLVIKGYPPRILVFNHHLKNGLYFSNIDSVHLSIELNGIHM